MRNAFYEDCCKITCEKEFFNDKKSKAFLIIRLFRLVFNFLFIHKFGQIIA